MKKGRDWLSNFDLSVMARRCKQTSALVPSDHEHVRLRGCVRTPEGSVSLATFSGQYSEVESALYTTALKVALRRVNQSEDERVSTRLKRKLLAARASQDPPAALGRGEEPGQARGPFAALNR